jgi:ribosome-associated protein
MPAASPPRRRAAAPAPSRGLADVLVRAADDAKALDIRLLHVGAVSDMTDYFVIATGTSDTHVRSTADKLVEAAREAGHRVHHVEGAESGKWAVLDFVDVIVHLFVPAMREYYQLERLWGDAPALPVAAGAGA